MGGVRNYPQLYSKDVTQRIHVEAGSSQYIDGPGEEESQAMDQLDMPESVPYSSRSIRSAYSTSDFFEEAPQGFNRSSMNSGGMGGDSLDQLVTTERRPKKSKKKIY